MDWQIRPYTTWPGVALPAWKRLRARFKASWSQTVRLLERELSHLGAQRIVLEMAVDERDLRNDGWIRANARPHSEGVILSFHSRQYGDLRYPCDRFNDWQDNVRAIALALEALRKVDRYGVTRRGEQYTGWKALPPASGIPTTVEAAARIIAKHSGIHESNVARSPETLRSAIREAQRRTHPDHGGVANDFHAVQAAKQILEEVGT